MTKNKKKKIILTLSDKALEDFEKVLNEQNSNARDLLKKMLGLYLSCYQNVIKKNGSIYAGFIKKEELELHEVEFPLDVSVEEIEAEKSEDANVVVISILEKLKMRREDKK